MKNFIVILLLLIVVSSLHGQELQLISSKPVTQSALKTTRIPSHDQRYKQVEEVDFNLEVLEKSDVLSLSYYDQEYQVVKETYTIRDSLNLSYSAVNLENDGNLVMSVLGDDIQGIITKGNAVYEIVTHSPGEHMIVEVDQSLYPDGDCYEELPPEEETPRDQGKQGETPLLNQLKSSFLESSLSARDEMECKIRVLVMYTPKAEAKSSNILNNIQAKVDLTNQSFRNSKINYEIELVYVGRTEYDESKGYLLKRFHYNNDGYMDEVHELCDIYSADLRVLICDMSNSCGVAYVNSRSSVVDYNCNSNYTFAHDLGHNLGCKHDHYISGSNNTFPYGFGYINLESRWRTIMSYNRKCSDNGTSCTRLLFWSNPEVMYGDEPMGSDIENSARVWNVNSENKMRLEQPLENVTFSPEKYNDNLHADLIAKKTIKTSGELNVDIGSKLSMTASDEISLQGGFSAVPGAEFSAMIASVSDCGIGEAAQTEEMITVLEEDFMNDHGIFPQADISPNPPGGRFTITFQNGLPESVEIRDVVSGKTVYSLSSPIEKKIEVDLSGHQKGEYTLLLFFEKETRSKPFVLA